MSSQISRRTLLQSSSFFAGAFAASLAAPSLLRGATSATKRVLFFTKSAGFQHSVVARQDGSPAFAERIMEELGKKHGFLVESSKDGTVFDGDLDKYDAFFFYTTGDLTQVGTDKQPAMSPQGKENLLMAVAKGKGFLGSHCASDTFHTKGEAFQNQEKPDPYIAMLGGEFIRHGRQQVASMRVVSPKFPGLGATQNDFSLNEEWYSLKNFAPDMHVILVNETKGMVDKDYERPPYPATWARMHEKGRVFYTSMGHREDVWTNSIFQELIVGALVWATGQVDVDIPSNLAQVTPEAAVLPKL